MPITQVAVAGLLKPYMVSAGMVGPEADPLIYAIAGGFTDGMLLTTSVRTVDTGTLGTGVGTGSVFLDSLILFKNMADSFAGYGIAGPQAISLANAIADGLASSMSLGLVTTTSTSVGIGAGSGYIQPTSSLSLFLSSFASAGISGAYGVSMASAISTALDSSLPASVVTVAITGSPSPLVSSGFGTGFIS